MVLLAYGLPLSVTARLTLALANMTGYRSCIRYVTLQALYNSDFINSRMRVWALLSASFSQCSSSMGKPGTIGFSMQHQGTTTVMAGINVRRGA